jgi:hypothetical protein
MVLAPLHVLAQLARVDRLIDEGFACALNMSIPQRPDQPLL